MRLAGRFVAILWVATSVLGCGRPQSTYFPTSGKTEVRVPITKEDPVYFGVELLHASGADVVLLEGIEPIDAKGDAAVAGLVSQLGEGTTWIGSGTKDDVRAAGIDLDGYMPLPGTAISASDGPVALAVRLTGTPPVFGFGGLRLWFRINDGPPEAQVFVLAGTVCSAPQQLEANRLCQVGNG